MKHAFARGLLATLLIYATSHAGGHGHGEKKAVPKGHGTKGAGTSSMRFDQTTDAFLNAVDGAFRFVDPSRIEISSILEAFLDPSISDTLENDEGLLFGHESVAYATKLLLILKETKQGTPTHSVGHFFDPFIKSLEEYRHSRVALALETQEGRSALTVLSPLAERHLEARSRLLSEYASAMEPSQGIAGFFPRSAKESMAVLFAEHLMSPADWVTIGVKSEKLRKPSNPIRKQSKTF